jgi:hypothetical protein
MLSLKMVQLIEQHSDELADGIVAKLRHSPRTVSLRKIPTVELHNRIKETLHLLHTWLLTNKGHHVEERYRELGRHHAAHEVSLPDLCWAIVLIKEHLWEFVGQRAFHTTPVEIHAEMELMRLLDLFFDGIIYHVAEGYEQVRGKIGDSSQEAELPPLQRWFRSGRNKEAASGQD